MGLFGEVDAQEVADNPFYVAPDTYKCILSEASLNTSQDGEREGLTFKWVIDDEDSDYYQNSISEWLTLHRDKSAAELTADDKKDNARIKQRLTQMGLSELEMNVLLDDDNLEDLVSLEAYVEVREGKGKVGTANEGKTFSNIFKVTLLTESD